MDIPLLSGRQDLASGLVRRLYREFPGFQTRMGGAESH